MNNYGQAHSATTNMPCLTTFKYKAAGVHCNTGRFDY